jgi:hypothetical protein
MIFDFNKFILEYQHKDTQMLLTELSEYFTIGFEIEVEVDRNRLNESKPFDYISKPYKKSFDLFKRNFSKFSKKYSDISDFHYDETLVFGLEIVNKPFNNLNIAIEYITDFFDEYNKQSIFKFKDTTSIHVNIGTSINKDWNIVKGLVMLSDIGEHWTPEPDYKPKVPYVFKDMENRSFNLFCKSLKNEILKNPLLSGNKDLYKNIISTTNIEEIQDNLIKIIKRILPQQEKIGKGIGFNIGKILYNIDKYVEFRYIGGDNITNEIVVEKIKYFCYIIYLMTSDYKQKDFIHKLFSFVNKIRDKYEKDLEFNKRLDRLLRK